MIFSRKTKIIKKKNRRKIFKRQIIRQKTFTEYLKEKSVR